jgi:hypothetical protein
LYRNLFQPAARLADVGLARQTYSRQGWRPGSFVSIRVHSWQNSYHEEKKLETIILRGDKITRFDLGIQNSELSWAAPGNSHRQKVQ